MLEKPTLKSHVNTAFTMACPPIRENEIYIYRKEEWFKVFIHETFHSLGLDFAKMHETPAKSAMFSIFPVNCDLRLYEMYSELWAEIINVIFICASEYKSTDTYFRFNRFNIKTLCKMIDETLHTERIFSIFQCVKILKHFHLQYNDLYSMEPEAVRNRYNYHERTNVFSYYILKSIAMYFYNDFIEWCCIHNAESIHFKKTLRNTVRLVEFIKQKYNSPEFIKAITFMETWFSHHKRGNDLFLMTTMRMSVIE
jgi:hypothetical protein